MASVHPALWNVPYKQNRYFTGQEETIRQLHQALRSVNTVGLTQAQGISGLGGIGKTQIAVEFAYRYGMEYEAVFWVRADSVTALISSFLDIARLLQLPERQEHDQRVIIEAVLRWLRLHTHWLLIFDNVDDLKLAERFLPITGPGHLIFTTRARALADFARRLEISQMDPETGALLLLRRAELLPLQVRLSGASRQDRDLACTIARELGGLPLALDQAGAYIKETPSTLARYLLLYQQRRADLLNSPGAEQQDYPATVATTWSLSFEKVAQANPAATDLLTLCAFLAPDVIPENIFTLSAPFLGDLLGPVAANQHQFDLACREALRFSLISREGDDETLTMHRLVQEILRENTPAEKQDGWRLLPAVFSKQKTITTRLEWKQRAVLAVHVASPNVKDADAWPACDVWVPHALVCANWIEQEHFSNQESTDLLNYAGFYLDARARYTEAETVYRHNLSIYEEQFEPTHPYIAQALNNLAALYEHQGNYTAAEPLLKRVLAIIEQQLRHSHSFSKIKLNNQSEIYGDQQTWKENAEFRRLLIIREQDLETALNNLAANCHSLGKYAEAEALYQRAQAISQQHTGAESSEEAQTLSNLGTLYVEQRRYGEAEQLLKRALAIQQRHLRNMHPITAEILNNLGELYAFQGNVKEAEPLLKQALEMREKVLGATHPNTAISFDNLAVLYYEQGKYQAAEPLWKKALLVWEQHDHPEAAKSLNNLAELYKAQKRYEEAEPLLERAVAICERLSGINHPDVAAPLSNLALLYMELGKYKEGEPLLKRALAIREQALGAHHPDTLTTRKNLETFYRNWNFIKQQRKTEMPADTATTFNNQAVLLYAQGKYAEAEPLYQRALAIRERQLGPTHPDTAQTLNNLAELYERLGKYRKAKKLHQRALAILQQQLGADHLDTANSLNNLAGLYHAQKRYKEAEPLLQQALAIRQSQLGTDHPDTAQTLNNLAALYDSQGKYEEAEVLYQQVLAICEKTLGPTHPDMAFPLSNLAVLYANQRKYSEAEPLLKRALAIREQQLGSQHPDTVDTRKDLEALYRARNRD